MSAGSSNYRNGIRAAVRGFWSGVFDYYQFYEAMEAAIRSGLPKAWYEGAADCGIQPAELSPSERGELQKAITNEFAYLDRFAVFVESNTKAAGGKLGPLFAKAEEWIVRYQDVANHAKVMACGDKKLRWDLGGTKKHCSSCLKLAGKVKRASYWDQMDVRPQNPPNPALECGGWLCGCTLTPTDEPMSKGPLPKLP